MLSLKRSTGEEGWRTQKELYRLLDQHYQKLRDPQLPWVKLGVSMETSQKDKWVLFMVAELVGTNHLSVVGMTAVFTTCEILIVPLGVVQVQRVEIYWASRTCVMKTLMLMMSCNLPTKLKWWITKKLLQYLIRKDHKILLLSQEILWQRF